MNQNTTNSKVTNTNPPDGEHSGATFGRAPHFHASVVFRDATGAETVKIEGDGKIYWNAREVEGDEDFKDAMLAVHRILLGMHR